MKFKNYMIRLSHGKHPAVVCDEDAVVSILTTRNGTITEMSVQVPIRRGKKRKK